MGSFSLEGRCRETRLQPQAAEVIIHHLQPLIKGKTSWIKHEAGSGVRKHFPSPSTALKSFQNHPDSHQLFSFLWSLQIWKECKKCHWVEPAATESLGCTGCTMHLCYCTHNQGVFRPCPCVVGLIKEPFVGCIQRPPRQLATQQQHFKSEATACHGAIQMLAMGQPQPYNETRWAGRYSNRAEQVAKPLKVVSPLWEILTKQEAIKTLPAACWIFGKRENVFGWKWGDLDPELHL